MASKKRTQIAIGWMPPGDRDLAFQLKCAKAHRYLRANVKIVQIVSAGYEQGGIENGLVAENDILRSMGHTVKTISSDMRPDLQHFSDYEFRQIPVQGIRKLIRTTFNVEAYRLAKRVCSEIQPDIIKLHTLQQPSAAILYALKRYRLVLCVHGPEEYTKWLLPWLLMLSDYKTRPYDLSDLTLLGKAHYTYFRYVTRPIFMQRIRKIRHVVTFSHYTQEMLKREGMESHYLPIGVNLFTEKPPRRPGRCIGYAGRLEKHKGVDYLLETFAKVVDVLPDARFVIAGEGSYGAALVAKVGMLHLEGKVEFRGHLRREELENFYHEIDLFLMASSLAETFGIAGVEAMSAGTPVLAPNIGGISDWLTDGECGYFVPVNDSDRYADLIIRLLRSEALLTTLGRNAIKSAKRFDMMTYIQNQQEFFDTIVQEHNS
jgi:glycosyltransferase involved in cell wall biosynthesis